MTEFSVQESIVKLVKQFILGRLLSAGFEKSPFSTACYGLDDYGDYVFELCILKVSGLEMLWIEVRQDRDCILAHLNCFELEPQVRKLEALQGLSGLKFHLVPNRTKLLDLDARRELCIGRSFFWSDHEKKLSRFEVVAKNFFDEIENKIADWYTRYSPNIVDHNGSVFKER